MCFTSFIQAILMAHYFQRGYRNGMHVRSAVICLVYQKALRLVPGSLEDKKGKGKEEGKKEGDGEKKDEKNEGKNDGKADGNSKSGITAGGGCPYHAKEGDKEKEGENSRESKEGENSGCPYHSGGGSSSSSSTSNGNRITAVTSPSNDANPSRADSAESNASDRNTLENGVTRPPLPETRKRWVRCLGTMMTPFMAKSTQQVEYTGKNY
jgi:hypothetical protein